MNEMCEYSPINLLIGPWGLYFNLFIHFESNLFSRHNDSFDIVTPFAQVHNPMSSSFIHPFHIHLSCSHLCTMCGPISFQLPICLLAQTTTEVNDPVAEVEANPCRLIIPSSQFPI